MSSCQRRSRNGSVTTSASRTATAPGASPLSILARFRSSRAPSANSISLIAAARSPAAPSSSPHGGPDHRASASSSTDAAAGPFSSVRARARATRCSKRTASTPQRIGDPSVAASLARNAGRTEPTAQPGDQALQRLHGRRRWGVAPQRVDQFAGAYQPTRPQREELDHQTLLGGARGDVETSVVEHRQAAQKPYLHNSLTVTPNVSSHRSGYRTSSFRPLPGLGGLQDEPQATRNRPARLTRHPLYQQPGDNDRGVTMTTTAYVDTSVNAGLSSRPRRRNLAPVAAYLRSTLTRRMSRLGVSDPEVHRATECSRAAQAKFYASTGRRWL